MDQKKTALVADDSNIVQKFVSFCLKQMNFRTVQASDGLQALEMMPKQEIDLIITDLNMPNMDGLSFLKSLKENIRYKDVPVIILSSVKDEKIKSECRSAGADFFMEKPFSANRFQYEVSKVLNNCGVLNEKRY